MGHIYGRISINADSSIPTLEAASPVSVPTASRGSDAQGPSTSSHSVEPKTLISRAPSSLPRSTIIGDLKLTILKSRLAALGVNAEFAGEGVLMCNAAAGATTSPVAVKKTGRGQVVLEGTPSPVYYLVRQEVYGLHAVVVS